MPFLLRGVDDVPVRMARRSNTERPQSRIPLGIGHQLGAKPGWSAVEAKVRRLAVPSALSVAIDVDCPFGGGAPDRSAGFQPANVLNSGRDE